MPATTPRPLRSALPTAPRTPSRTPARPATGCVPEPPRRRRPPTRARARRRRRTGGCGSAAGSSWGCRARSMLLRGVRGQGEPRTATGRAGNGPQSQPDARVVADLDRPQPGPVPGLLRAGVADVQLVQIGGEPADERRARRVGVRLVRTGAEPGGVTQPRRQVEPDADPRPGAVPVGRRHDLDLQRDLVGDGPAVGDVDGPRAVRRPDADADHGPLRVDGDDAVHEPVQAAFAPAALRRATVRAVVGDPAVVVGGRPPQLQPRTVDVEAEQPAQPAGVLVELGVARRVGPAHLLRRV